MTTISQPLVDPFAASRYPTPPFSPPQAESSARTTDRPASHSSRPRPASAHITSYIPPLSPPADPQTATTRAAAHAHGGQEIASASATRKRQSHNPSTLPSASFPLQVPTPEYVLHPTIASYQLAHPRRPLVGFGPYILLQTLGEGEFGKVKLGVQTEYGEEVAVKLIRRGSVDNQARLSKVEREIEVLKTVRHPNIVRLFDVIETEKYIGIILDFANGGELFDHILAHRYLKEKDAAKLFAQLISGVHYLHRKHIVHRDLKLENLLLDKHRNVIITDFGFANRFEHAKDDLMATSCGSPCYAAPELVISEGLYVGSAVDIWSCGVILYAMLSGYLPFDDDPNNPEGDNINLLYRYIINTPLSFPEYISSEAQDLLRRMLVPDPVRRCDLQTVMSHPWLRAYAPLFDLSVTDLEMASQEQLQNKRAASRRDMQARVKLQEQATQKAVLARSQSSRPGSTGVTAGSLDLQAKRAREPRHHSALPGTATMPHDLNRIADGQSASPPAVKRAKTDFEGVLATEGQEASGEAVIPEPTTPTRSRTTSMRSSPPPIPTAGVTPPSQLTERPSASANRNRHTIQVEYDSESNYDKMRDLLDTSHGKKANVSDSEAQQAVYPTQEAESFAVDGAALAQPTVSRASTINSKSSASSNEGLAEIAEGFSSRPDSVPASPPATPKASKVAKAIQPQESPSTPRASAKDSSKPPSQNVPPPKAPQVFSQAKLPPITFTGPTTKKDRSRKGISMDRFSLGKLLGVTTSANIDRSKPLRGSTSPSDLSKRMDVPYASDAVNSPRQSRRKTLTLMVAEPFNKTNPKFTPSPRSEDAPATRLEASSSTTSISAESRSAPMVVQADRILSPGPHERSPSTLSVTPVEAFAKQDASTADSHTNPRTASSSAARKVMDWFRRKSLAKETLSSLQSGPNESSSTRGPPSVSRRGEPVPNAQTPEIPGSVDRDVKSIQPTIVVNDDERSAPILAAAAAVPRSSILAAPATGTTSSFRAENYDARLKVHSGVVDQSALTSRPVPEVLSDVLRVLRSMGIDVKKESDFRFRCTRARRRKSGATTGLGLSSVMSKGSAGGEFQAGASSSSIDRRGLPVPASPSSLLATAGGGLKGMLLRRGSSYSSSPRAELVTGPVSGELGSPSGSSTGLASPGRPVSPLTPEPVYGEHSLDGGDEIRFSVEITRIRNLPGLYSLDIKRLRGNVWSFKFVYQTILDRSETLTH